MSVKALESRVRSLQHRLTYNEPKTLVFVVEDGQDLTPEQREQIRPGDTVVKRYVPTGFLGDV